MLIPQKDPVGLLISVPFRRAAGGKSTLAFLGGLRNVLCEAPPKTAQGTLSSGSRGVGWTAAAPSSGRGTPGCFRGDKFSQPNHCPPSLFLKAGGETPILNGSSGFRSQKSRPVFKLDFCLFQFLCRWTLFPVKGRSALGSPSSSYAKASAPGPIPVQDVSCRV